MNFPQPHLVWSREKDGFSQDCGFTKSMTKTEMEEIVYAKTIYHEIQVG